MYDLNTLKAIVEARKHLKSDRELTSFEVDRSVKLFVEEDEYLIRGYLAENILYFDLHPVVNGWEQEAVATGIPLIAQIACLSDQFRHERIRCKNVSGDHDWIIEFTKTLDVVLSEYELLPGPQPDEPGCSVYLANENGEILSVEARYLTIFEPVQDVSQRMAMESALSQFQLHLINAPTGSVNKELLDAAFMLERALNAGHVDMVNLETELVLESASNQLLAIGSEKHSEQLQEFRRKIIQQRKLAQEELGFNP